MTIRLAGCITVVGMLGAALVLSSGGCGGGTCDPGFTGLSGLWQIEEQESSPSAICVRFRTFTRDVVQDGSELLIFTDDDVLSTELCGNTFVIPTPYEEAEDGGTTIVTRETWTVLSPTSAMGTSTWSWSGPGGSCQGESTMMATKLP